MEYDEKEMKRLYREMFLAANREAKNEQEAGGEQMKLSDLKSKKYIALAGKSLAKKMKELVPPVLVKYKKYHYDAAFDLPTLEEIEKETE